MTPEIEIAEGFYTASAKSGHTEKSPTAAIRWGNGRSSRYPLRPFIGGVGQNRFPRIPIESDLTARASLCIREGLDGRGARRTGPQVSAKWVSQPRSSRAPRQCARAHPCRSPSIELRLL